MTARLSPGDTAERGGGGPAPPQRTLAGVFILAVVLGLLVAGAWMGWVRGGPAEASGAEVTDRAGALRLVAAVCGVASLGGWIVARLGAGDPALAVSRSLAAILLRLLLPLVLLGWLSTPRGSWPEAGRMRDSGAAGLLVVFYLTLLATDILLHIMWGPRGPRLPPHPRHAVPDRSMPAERADPNE